MEVHALAFELILLAAKDKGLLKGKTIGVDATDLEAYASMKSIVRKDNGDDWREYLRKKRLASAILTMKNCVVSTSDESRKRKLAMTIGRVQPIPIRGSVR